MYSVMADSAGDIYNELYGVNQVIVWNKLVVGFTKMCKIYNHDQYVQSANVGKKYAHSLQTPVKMLITITYSKFYMLCIFSQTVLTICVLDTGFISCKYGAVVWQSFGQMAAGCLTILEMAVENASSSISNSPILQ